MILVKLRGGLANQMFQYATARRLAHVHDTEVRIDTGWYERLPPDATPRQYLLDYFAISGRRASLRDTAGTNGIRNARPAELPLALARKVRPRYRFVAERHFHFDPAILELPDWSCLFGYWLSERYFADIRDIVRQEFTFVRSLSPSNEELRAEIAGTRSVAVHVRRGDYVTSPLTAARHGVCDVGYYQRARTVIEEQVPSPTYFVFSDDARWAADNLDLGPNVTVIDDNPHDPISDLRLMAAARHNIVANSSFSWWAAWLNDNPEKLVVAPTRWMRDPSFDDRDVVPARWTRV
jgi:hypothetical protein